MWGWGVGGGVLTFLTSTSFTLRKMHTLRMLSYDQGGGVWWGVLTSLTSTSFTLRKMQTLHMLSVVSKIIPTKRFKSAQVNHKQNIFTRTKTKTYHFRGRLWDKSYRALKKWRPPSMLHKKNKTCTKKGTLGRTAGHGVTTLPCCRLWLLHCHKRSGTASVEKRKKLEE